MKKIIILVMLAIACPGKKLWSQLSDDAFRPSSAQPLRHEFRLHFRQRNQVTLSLSSMKLLPKLMEADSILTAALHDISLLEDTADIGVGSRKLEMLWEAPGDKRLRVTRIPAASTYGIDSSGLYLLKVAQDTLVITNVYKQSAVLPYKRRDDQWRMVLLVNDLEDITGAIKPMMDSVMRMLAGEYAARSGWTTRRDTSMHIEADYEVGIRPFVIESVYQSRHEIMEVSVFGNLRVQNIAQQFVPSLELPGISLGWRDNSRITKFTFAPEAMFFFEKNTQGNIEAKPNMFLNISFSRKAVEGKPSLPAWSYPFRNSSLGILIGRQGNFLEKHTFRLKFAGISYRNLQVDPQFFFDPSFKTLSPSLRLGLAF